MSNIVKGRKGEELAAGYLESKGYRVVCRNWTCRWGEIDLITEKNSSIVFVEVKYRDKLDFGGPLEAIDFRKRKKLKRTISYFLTKYDLWSREWRLDALGILKSRREFVVEHFEWIELPR